MALSKLPEANAVELFRSNTLQTPFITTDSSLDWICNTRGLRGRRRGTVVCLFFFIRYSLLHGRRHGTGSNTSSSRLTQGWRAESFCFHTTSHIKGLPTQNWAHDRAGYKLRQHLLLHQHTQQPASCDTHPRRSTQCYRMSHYRMARIELRQCFIGWNRVATNPPIRAQRTTKEIVCVCVCVCVFVGVFPISSEVLWPTLAKLGGCM